jgi:RNA polymerase sigma factor (sigma-70 family)
VATAHVQAVIRLKAAAHVQACSQHPASTAQFAREIVMCRPVSIVERRAPPDLGSQYCAFAPRFPDVVGKMCFPAAATRSEVSETIHKLYDQHSPALVRHLARRTGCSELARELANEAFLRIIRLTPAKLRSIEQPQAYLWSICANLLRDWGRGRVLDDRSRRADPTLDEMVDQVAVLETRDTLRRLEKVIGKLKPRTREIFLAQRIEGLSYAEIAERNGLSVKGVEKQMSKAIAKIDRMLDRG